MKTRNFVAKHSRLNRAVTMKPKKGKGSYSRKSFKKGE